MYQPKTNLLSSLPPLNPNFVLTDNSSPFFYDTNTITSKPSRSLVTLSRYSAFRRPPRSGPKRIGHDPAVILRFTPESASAASTSDPDLPTSFAPLLSSSHLTSDFNVPPDLIHSLFVDAVVTLEPGSKEVPFSKVRGLDAF